MTTYVVLPPGNEDTWESASEERRAAMDAKHGELARAVEVRAAVGGADGPTS